MQNNDNKPASGDEPDGLPTPRRFWAMASIILGITLSVLDATIINMALPQIARDFGVSASAAVWVILAYQIATLGMLLPLAQLGDRFGYRRVYLVGVAVFTAGMVGSLLASSLAMLAVTRALQGMGGASIMAVNSALVRLTYPAALLGRAIALNSAVVAVGSVAGPTVASLILGVASWPWLFGVQLPLCVLVWLLARRSLPHNTRPPPASPFSLLDVVLNMLMFALLLLAADALGARRGQAGDNAGLLPGFGLLLGAVAVSAFYLRRQWRLPDPLFPVDLLRIRVFALSMCCSVCSFAAQMMAFIGLPFLLLEGQGRNVVEAGLLISAWPAGTALMAPLAGRLIARFPGGLLGGIGLGAMALGLVLLAALPAGASGFSMGWRLALCGLGFGLFQSPNNHTIVTTAPLQRTGAAGGMLSTARLTGQSIGAVLLGIIFSISGVQEGGPTVALALGAALAAAAGVCSLLRLRG